MKLISGLALSAALLVGCGDQNTESNAVAEVEVAPAAAPASMFVEYMYCDAGADFSQENYAKLTAAWNQLDMQSAAPLAGAFAIVPKVKNDRYDRMWANIWSSVEARDAGWKDWTENQAEAFGAEFDSTMVCNPEKRFLFESMAVTAPAPKWDAKEPFQATYNFCSFKEGKTQVDGAAAEAAFTTWIADQRTVGRGMNYMSYLHIPQFDPATAGGAIQGFQFVRTNFWSTAAEQAADMAAWMAEGNTAREISDAVYDCQDFGFDLYSIKRLGS